MADPTPGAGVAGLTCTVKVAAVGPQGSMGQQHLAGWPLTHIPPCVGYHLGHTHPLILACYDLWAHECHLNNIYIILITY